MICDGLRPSAAAPIFSADPQTLLYATGGLAVGEFKYSAQTTSSV
jgi:hypothetical protein